MADASSAILFIIGLWRAGIENWVKYAILRVRMSLCWHLYASENQVQLIEKIGFFQNILVAMVTIEILLLKCQIYCP